MAGAEPSAAGDAMERRRSRLRDRAHAGRNLLSTVASIAALSIAGNGSVEAARDAFLGRLQALAQALGSDDGVEGVPLADLAAAELRVHAARALFDGPTVQLSPKAAQSFALAIHELTTNAARHGALSAPGGRVAAIWRVEERDGERRLHFDWQESGGPPVRAPSCGGFGQTLLRSIIGAEFDCEPSLDFGEAGFRYRFDAPLRAIAAA
jgi:two-component sensor histidine kinase